MRKLLLVGLVLVFGACKKQSSSSSAVGAAQMPGAPSSTKDQDALWKLAPAGAKLGVVASPRAVGMVEGAAARLNRHAAEVPELASKLEELKAKLREKLGTDNPDLAAIGWTADKGFALFELDGGSTVMILPVANRDKFLQVAKGTKGADTDTFNGMTCKTVDGRYVCAEPASAIDQLGKGELASHLKLAGARGDIEVAGSEGPTEFAIVGQLASGAFVMRGAVKGLPAQQIAMFEGHDASIDTKGLAGFGIIDIAGKAPVPPVELVPGVQADELYGQIAAPVTITIPPGAQMFDVHVPFKDTTLAKKLVDQCTSLEPLAALGATVKDGVCHIPVPPMQMAFDAWVDGKELRLGQKGASGKGQAVALGPIADELAKGNWMMSFYGRGTLLALPFAYPMPPDSPREMTNVFARMYALLNEIGFGVRKDGDTIRFLLAQRSIFSNPDDVVSKVLAIPAQDILAGKSAAAAKAIADAAPSSPFAGDDAAGASGLIVPTAGIGILAAVAIPAFMDYMKKAKKPEAALQLNKIAKNSKVYFNVNGKFVQGKSATLPARPCCEEGKCPLTNAWADDPVWKELDFQIDEPNLFQYTYESKSDTEATATAVGDLDCDGSAITYRLDLSAPAGNPMATITEPPANSD